MDFDRFGKGFPVSQHGSPDMGYLAPQGSLGMRTQCSEQPINKSLKTVSPKPLITTLVTKTMPYAAVVKRIQILVYIMYIYIYTCKYTCKYV